MFFSTRACTCLLSEGVFILFFFSGLFSGLVLNDSHVAGIPPEDSSYRSTHYHSRSHRLEVNWVTGGGWRGDTAAAAPDGPCPVALLALHVLAAAGALYAAGHNGNRDKVEGEGCAAQDAPNKRASFRWRQCASVLWRGGRGSRHDHGRNGDAGVQAQRGHHGVNGAVAQGSGQRGSVGLGGQRGGKASGEDRGDSRGKGAARGHGRLNHGGGGCSSR